MAAHPITSHEEIQRWAEARGATPAAVKRTGGNDDVGIIRLDFPGYSGEDSLQTIDWDEWFEKFDEQRLALLIEDDKDSNFNKLVRRNSAGGSQAQGDDADEVDDDDDDDEFDDDDDEAGDEDDEETTDER